MDPVAKKSYAPLYFQTQANLAELEEMAAEYERASKAVSPKAMPTTTAPTTTGKAPVVDLEESAAQPPEALPSSGSGARLGEMPVFFFYCRSQPVDRPCKRKYAPGCGPYNLFLLKLGV